MTVTGISVRELAGVICRYKPVYLDTETTGLGDEDEICEISVIDHGGSTLLDTLVKPTFPIHESVSAIHGITNEMVSTAPSFPDILPALQEVLDNRVLVIYNQEYDIRMLKQSAWAHQLEFESPHFLSYCAMELYAEYYGQWSNYHGSYKWQRLGDAMKQQGLKYEGKLHRALSDTHVTRLLMIKMAGGDLGE